MSDSIRITEARDDRTQRTLAELLGSGLANVALTHFSLGRVEVYANAGTLATPNGFLAAIATMNMLSRFVGTVQLRVVGTSSAADPARDEHGVAATRRDAFSDARSGTRTNTSTTAFGDAKALDASLQAALEDAFVRLRRIDTRPGRSVSFRFDAVDGDATPANESPARSAARVLIGQVEAPAGSLLAHCDAVNSEVDIHIAFDAWTCALRRGGSVGGVRSSSAPFGALAAACFAAAEVFKTLIVSSVPAEDAERLRRRYTTDWRFSVWRMERLAGENADEDWSENVGENPDEHTQFAIAPLDSLPTLSVSDVLQVGAGAVGNAAALAFSSTVALVGDVLTVDAKRVDTKNLNRCYYFTERHVGDSKVDVLEQDASRPGITFRGRNKAFAPAAAAGVRIILSTVDNNEVRHRMQEALPDVLVEGATGGTTVAVGVHRPGNGRSCLVCRHPDPTVGANARAPLSLSAAAAITGLTEDEIASGRVDGEMAITDELIARVRSRSDAAADILQHAKGAAQDMCGAIGDLRAALGVVTGPREASVPFVSNLAGVLAAAEVVKILLRDSGVSGVPVLDNVVQIDLARNYARNERLSFAEPPQTGCVLCEERADLVTHIYASREPHSPNRVR